MENPLNREPPVEQLTGKFVSPLPFTDKTFSTADSTGNISSLTFCLFRFITADGGYDRNHGYYEDCIYIIKKQPSDVGRPIPHIDGETHIVRVDGCVDKNIECSASQLREDFPQHEVLCALQCAGNRRHTMRTKLKEVVGVDWGDGAVMNCSWKGPRLRDVLNKAGVKVSDPSKAHIAFACYATLCQDDHWYGGSIPLERGMRDDGDVILALQVRLRKSRY